ncbi:MAG TPA: hypothetical protein V6D02_11750 [Candidatus Obscuribacterales bacterium]
MTTSPAAPPLTPEPDACLAQAVQAFCSGAGQPPQGKALTAALLALERSAKQTRRAIAADALLGTWRLCFSAAKKAKYQSGQPVGSGFYMPQWAIAHLTFAPDVANPDQLTITNTLQLGWLTIRFTGPARYPGKQNLLAFDFTQLTVACAGWTLYQGAVPNAKRAGKPFATLEIAQLPFFAFFAATDQYIAARGRGGGLALWVKPTPSTAAASAPAAVNRPEKSQ